MNSNLLRETKSCQNLNLNLFNHYQNTLNKCPQQGIGQIE